MKDGKEKLLGARRPKQLIRKANFLHMGHRSKESTGCQERRPLVFICPYPMQTETSLTFSSARHTFREEALTGALWTFIIGGINYFLKNL